MPHIEVIGAPSLKSLVEKFEPLNMRENNVVVKATAVFHNTRDRRALIQALVVESHVHHKFYILLVEKSKSIMVRLDPLTDPEKTDGVKHLVALVAYWIQSLKPTSLYGMTNLGEFLIAEPRDTLGDI